MSRAAKISEPDDMPAIDFDDPRWKVVGRGIYAKHGVTYPLDMLRKALDISQGEIAERAHMTQGEVSHIERRKDRRVSTLKRYVKALSGNLRMFVEINGQTYELDLS